MNVEDYAALEAKAYRAGIYAGELQMKINALESENTRLQAELSSCRRAFVALLPQGGVKPMEQALKTGE
jgi:FtsZ-binding cell division protein ZapB